MGDKGDTHAEAPPFQAHIEKNLAEGQVLVVLVLAESPGPPRLTAQPR